MSHDESGFILAVDDDPISLRLLQGALQKGGIQVLTASHAKEAREILIEKEFRQCLCVVSDYRMPEMTGLELSQWISKEDKTLSCILLSAEADKQMISDSLRVGVLDFLEKPLILNVVRNAVQKAIDQTKSKRNLQESRNQVNEIQKFHHTILGLQHTASIQQITFRFIPMHEVGGDFINIFPLPNDTYIVVATDVSGHDLKAAFVSAFFQGVTRGMIEKGASIREIYTFTNRFLIDEWGKDTGGVAMSLSTCSAIIDLRNKTCDLTNHGFPSPYYVTEEGKIREMIQGGPPLGWFSDIEENEIHFPCQEGGAIFFWSDGLDDTAVRMGINSFSVLYRFLESPEGEKEIQEKAVDDLMVVRFEMTNAQKEGGWHPIFFTESCGADHLKIDHMQKEWQNSLQFLFPTIPEERIYDILLATRESYLNGMIHGAKKDLNKKVLLQICYHRENKKIRVRIDDPGVGHGLDLAEPMESLQLKLHDEHSGLTMIKFLCQEIKNERNGATVIMDFDFEAIPLT